MMDIGQKWSKIIKSHTNLKHWTHLNTSVISLMDQVAIKDEMVANGFLKQLQDEPQEDTEGGGLMQGGQGEWWWEIRTQGAD